MEGSGWLGEAVERMIGVQKDPCRRREAAASYRQVFARLE
jgi:hypothetical protein